MSLKLIIDSVLLGLVEGFTEFLPVSSTGHLILFDDFLGFEGPPGHVFEIVIQLGAILSVCAVYFERLWRVLVTLPRSREAQRFVLLLVMGFLPAGVLGVLLHGFIKSVLFSPYVVSVALLLGGFAILWIERHLPAPRYRSIDEFTPVFALKVGFCQALAMIPGVSRAGATILGAALLGAERRCATEFSFLLALPTMLGATVYDLYKNWSVLDGSGIELIAIGFVAAFFAALVVVRTLIGFVSRHGFAAFGWYRIVVGGAMLVVLLAH
jgi:undecaprenyl-diphosphatase